MCWMEIEAFRGIPVGDKHVRDLQARQLRNKYFNKKYLFGPNSPASKDAQRQVNIGIDVEGKLSVVSQPCPSAPPMRTSNIGHAPPNYYNLFKCCSG